MFVVVELFFPESLHRDRVMTSMTMNPNAPGDAWSSTSNLSSLVKQNKDLKKNIWPNWDSLHEAINKIGLYNVCIGAVGLSDYYPATGRAGGPGGPGAGGAGDRKSVV